MAFLYTLSRLGLLGRFLLGLCFLSNVVVCDLGGIFDRLVVSLIFSFRLSGGVNRVGGRRLLLNFEFSSNASCWQGSNHISQSLTPLKKERSNTQ